jgi:hypothetical protein
LWSIQVNPATNAAELRLFSKSPAVKTSGHFTFTLELKEAAFYLKPV